MRNNGWRLDDAFRPMMPGPAGAPKPLRTMIERWVLPPAIVQDIQDASGEQGAGFASALLRQMDIRYEVERDGQDRIPASGAAIIVSNHPFGVLDGMVLLDMLSRIRPDVKFLANSLLTVIPAIHDVVLPVDVLGIHGGGARPAGAKRALDWLSSGGLLAVFPAGEVSHLNWKEQLVADPNWSDGMARLARLAGAPVTPVYIDGSNGAGFQIAGVVHPRLRTWSLVRELDNKRGRTIRIRVGTGIGPRDLSRMGGDREAAGYLRFRTYILGIRAGAERSSARSRTCAEVAAPEPLASMQSEVSRLDAICSLGQLTAYCAQAPRIPSILRETGRLRELTFRDAGEGAGKALDLDEFDARYWHLFLWNAERMEVAGAYRLGSSEEILPGRGVAGLYTSTLFRLDSRLFETMGPAIELGRSFVRKEYQRQYAPLALLWKGICIHVAARPQHAVLFGAVSISKDYTPASRDLMVAFLRTLRDEPLARFVQARHPYRFFPPGQWHDRQGRRFLTDIETLSGSVSDIEADRKGVPVLLRQYLKAGGRTLGVSVDPGFGNVVDALVAVDLRRTPRTLLERHMGAEAAGRFLDFHAVKAGSSLQAPEAGV